MATGFMRLKQVAGRLPGASLLLSLFALLLWSSPALSQWCQWDRSRPWQLWRWFTGHFSHWSVEHLVWDTVVFLALGALCEWRNRTQFLICMVAAAIAITGATSLFLPGIQTYRGLSGLDSALFGWLSMATLRTALARQDRRTMSIVFLFMIAFTMKVAIECVTSSTLFVSSCQSGFVPVPLAHAVGVLSGLGLNLVSRSWPGRPAFMNEKLAIL